MDVVRLEDLRKSFGATQAVQGLSACVPAGSIYGFLGPNGAGKTTVLRMIMNIFYPDSGTVTLFGGLPAVQAKERIGYMPEEHGLYPKMTVRKVLSYIGAIKGMPRAALAEAIPRWLDRVGLGECADKKAEELSRGMQQKLQFVATAINDPDLMILDEPFSGLDPVNLDLVKSIILEMREAGKTVLFSTHMMEQAERLCDSILLVNRGVKLLDDTLDGIRSSYPTGKVLLHLEGDSSFIHDLACVASVSQENKTLEVTLQEDADPQTLLEQIVGRVRVQRFEVKTPSLHEIFVQRVGESRE